MGTTRKLPSGRFQGRAWNPALGKQVTIGSFKTVTEAKARIKAAETDMARGTWRSPAEGKIRFRDYATRWLEEMRPQLAHGTWELREGLLRNHIFPTFGQVPLGAITPESVRSWNAALAAKDVEKLQATGTRGTIAPRSYQLLRQILETAVDDELIPSNRARIKGATKQRPVKRPVVEIGVVYAIIEAIETGSRGHGSQHTHAAARDRAFILMAVFSGLRIGELRGLRFGSLDLAGGTAYVYEQWQSGTTTDEKTEASRRVVPLPETLVSEMRDYVATVQNTGPADLVFPGEFKGGQRSKQDPTRPTSDTAFGRRWRKAVAAVPLAAADPAKKRPALRFHDLRHCSATYVARTGAPEKERMARLGHDSPEQHLEYQSPTDPGQLAIAAGLEQQIRDAGYGRPLNDRGLAISVHPGVEVVGAEHDEATYALDGDATLGGEATDEALLLS